MQRSSISHILSGRNKPSLDFVLKVLSSFPEVELYWLLNGKGHFPSEVKSIEESSLEAKNPINVISEVSEIKKSTSLGKTIERIVIFYSDGSFKNYEDI